MKLAFAAFTAFALSLTPLAAQETDEGTAEDTEPAVAEQAEAAEPDEVESALATALEAYREGDLELATEEVEYAQQLLAQKKAARLTGFLPEPMEGWTKEEGESGGMPGLGGMMASATYVGPEGDRVEVQIMAENQMVASMMMMFNNPVMMGQMGELKRVGRQKVVLTDDGELQAMLDNNVLVSITGDAPAETKEEYFTRIDIDELKEF